MTENLYEVHKATGWYATYCKVVIVIRRKPSQIPWAIDSELMRSAWMSQLDGPNDRVSYLFPSPEKAQRAEEFLHGCGWKRAETAAEVAS